MGTPETELLIHFPLCDLVAWCGSGEEAHYHLIGIREKLLEVMCVGRAEQAAASDRW
jgi:hypothetical protein